jgi:hypothetical protein
VDAWRADVTVRIDLDIGAFIFQLSRASFLFCHRQTDRQTKRVPKVSRAGRGRTSVQSEISDGKRRGKSKKATMGIPEGLSGADQAMDEVNPDPLAAASENASQIAEAHTSESKLNGEQLSKRTYSSQELQKIISQRQVVDMSDEDMDPIEWTVRKVIPIPAEYYWDAVSEEQHDQIPARTKVWHKTISFLCGAQQWTERSVAKPLAASLGLTDSRFDYVVDNMTDEEWEKSRATASARRSQGKKEDLQSKQDVEVGTEVSTSSS